MATWSERQQRDQLQYVLRRLLGAIDDLNTAELTGGGIVNAKNGQRAAYREARLVLKIVDGDDD